MATLISGSTGVNKITDGTITNADIASGAAIAESKLATIGGTIRSVQHSRIVNNTTISGTVSGFSGWTEIGNKNITPVSANSIFIIDWIVGWNKANERTGCGFSLFIGGSQTDDALGSDLGGNRYLGHRMEMNSGFYMFGSGTARWNASNTNTTTIGLGIQAYDENIGYTITAGTAQMPLRMIFTEIVL